MEIDKTFINMVNENHTKSMEWKEVYEIGRQSVAEAHRKREERKYLRRRENLDSILAALGGMMTTTLIFIMTAIIVLIF